ncbi:MAG: hypothetical protein ACKO3T_11150 [Planctomycetaceae bacterium]
MLRRHALCTLATALVASPLLASPGGSANHSDHTPQPDLLQQLDHCLQLLQQQPAALRHTATCTETIALLQHTRNTIVTGQQGSAACWQACSDTVTRLLATLPPQSAVTTPLRQLQLLLTNACRHCLGTTVSH